MEGIGCIGLEWDPIIRDIHKDVGSCLYGDSNAKQTMVRLDLISQYLPILSSCDTSGKDIWVGGAKDIWVTIVITLIFPG